MFDTERLTSLTEEPTFSVPHGFYSQPVILELEASDPQAVILFTTDGSVPTRLNGQIFKDSIVIGATTDW